MISSNLTDGTGKQYQIAIDDTSSARWATVNTSVDNLGKRVESLENKMEAKVSMNKFDFGKITNDTVRMSFYGVAIKNIDGQYVAYDSATHSVMDVDLMNFPSGNFLFKMPVAIKDVRSGDVIIHNRVPMFVTEVKENTLRAVDVREGVEKDVMLTKSPFGFNFVTKIISLIENAGFTADENNPFGAFMPFLLMSEGSNDDLAMLMMMNSGATSFNPMMMYLLMKDKGDMKDVLPFMMMMQNK